MRKEWKEHLKTETLFRESMRHWFQELGQVCMLANARVVSRLAAPGTKAPRRVCDLTL